MFIGEKTGFAYDGKTLINQIANPKGRRSNNIVFPNLERKKRIRLIRL
jgi:hypothetical protein